MTNDNDLRELRSLREGQHCYLNWHQGGGAICYKFKELLIVYSVPLYGGVEQYEETFLDGEADKLLSLVYSWT